MVLSQTLPESPAEPKFDPKSAIYVPLGAASPFWFLYAGAASAGVAYWWFSRWRGATNIEALFAQAPATATIELPEAIEAAASPAEPEAEIPEPVATAEPEAAFVAVAELLTEPEPVVEAAPAIELEPIIEPEPMVEAASEPAVATKAKTARAMRPIVDDPA
ncbi:hypothetical protein [Phenylobacterium sp.]|uniref:hypothetical protein n=1 Tax=Phenylobacterium sp. TaxID=1871053 RepID=UPI0027364225|nr:hypothetical protein [Phenylobacterium sp.]MDP3855167.1 hypothetical protein [Phenylobacterium sp.]